jgi:hypothetical protein
VRFVIAVVTALRVDGMQQVLDSASAQIHIPLFGTEQVGDSTRIDLTLTNAR